MVPLISSSKRASERNLVLFLVSYVGEGHGSLYNASTKEERRKRKAKRRERSDQIY